jgi:formate-dependent nitrite reductase membrane component NrfD
LIGALIMMGYMGFVYTASKGIPFWNSPLHPVLYIAYAVRGGIAALVVTLAVRGQSLAAAGGLLEIWIAITAMVIVLWGLEIQGAVSSGDETARRSVRDLLAGRLALYFYGGTLVVGLVVPLILTTGVIAPLSAGILAAIGLASMIGDFFMKYSSIKAGVHLPVRLPRLHRSNQATPAAGQRRFD